MELSGVALNAFTSVLFGLATMFGATIYTLQSRHHGISEHERSIQEECCRIHHKAEKNKEDKEKLRNLDKQLQILRTRYDWALCAYIFMMVQALVVIMYGVFVVAKIVSGTKVPVSVSWSIVFMLPGILSLFCHICGDLLPAQKTQRVNREWWDHIAD